MLVSRSCESETSALSGKADTGRLSLSVASVRKRGKRKRLSGSTNRRPPSRLAVLCVVC